MTNRFLQIIDRVHFEIDLELVLSVTKRRNFTCSNRVLLLKDRREPREQDVALSVFRNAAC
jgi:hypothetical protein